MSMIHEKRCSLSNSKIYRGKVVLRNLKHKCQRLMNIKEKFMLLPGSHFNYLFFIW